MDKYRIMIVDDEADVREGIVSHVNWDALGYEVVAECENGQDALEKADQMHIDVVLTDIKMPFMDGLEMSDRLSQLYPGIKIIILTGFDEFEYAKRAIRLNVVEYVLKPVNAGEISDILRRVHHMLDESIAQKRDMDDLRARYERHLPLQKDRFMLELLWGTVPKDDIEALVESYNLPIRNAPHRIVSVFEVDRQSRDNALVPWELVPVSIQQIIKEQFNGRCECAVLLSSSTIVAICAWQSPRAIGDVMSIADEICARCMRALNIRMIAGIGKSYEAMGDIHSSFEEAKKALTYREVAGAGKAIYIGDMEQGWQARGTAFAEMDEERLLAVIKFGTDEQIRLMIADSLRYLESSNDWDSQVYMLGLLNVLCRIVQNHGLENENDVMARIQNLMELPLKSKDQQAAADSVVDICISLREYINEKRKSATREIANDAKHYIDAHYSESDLSVDRMCEHLHVSQSYFSTVFKQETGVSYIQYLTELRMTQAMTLLQQTDDKTYVIARKVGYEEPNYFSYVFKKRYGISPTKYRAGQ